MGSPVLAYMYNQLGIASHADSIGIGGCLMLLQDWIYEYFLCFHPLQDRTIVDLSCPEHVIATIALFLEAPRSDDCIGGAEDLTC